MRVMKRAINLVACWVAAWLLGLGANGAAVAATTWPGPQGDTYASIAKLPDWSGFWAFYLKGGAQQAAAVAAGTDHGLVHLTPAYAKLRAAASAAKAQENLSRCLPAGVPGVMLHRILFQYLFTPGQVTMLFEDGEVRRIHTDGRLHVALADQTESFMGDSIGHWEGNTLVVDTIGFPNGTLWQNYGVIATLKAHLVEHMFRKDANHMEIDSVLTDPDIFTQPYVTKYLYELSDIPITEEECLAGNRDTGTSVDLTPPPLGE